MKNSRIETELLRLAGVLAISVAGLSLAACDDNEMSAEEIGESIDDAADDAGDAMDDAADDVDDAFDDMADEP